MELFGNVLFIFTTLAVWITVQGAVSYTKCTKVNSCSCLTDTGLVVDLSPLTDTSGKAKFADVTATTGDGFSWNPCIDFTEKAETNCVNVAACQIQKGGDKTRYFALGDQNSAAFQINDKKNLEVTYTSKPDPTLPRIAFVELVCDESKEGTLTATGESPSASGKYLMSLTSKYACAKKPEPGSSSPTLTVGSILLIASKERPEIGRFSSFIIVLVLVIVYVIVGVSINKFARHATGKEVVPNYTFWTALPGLIKDGVLFIFSKCRRKGSEYNKI